MVAMPKFAVAHLETAAQQWHNRVDRLTSPALPTAHRPRRAVRLVDGTAYKILDVADFYQMYSIPSLRFHPLRGSRRGELPTYPTGRWILIVMEGDTAQSIIIEEVSNHYDD